MHRPQPDPSFPICSGARTKGIRIGRSGSSHRATGEERHKGNETWLGSKIGRMKSSLISRLERLEARTEAREPFTFLYGWLTHLPEDSIGERHTIIVKREPTGSPHVEWCDFEERPGPAMRSEERRVGKECRSRWSPYH